VTLPKLAVANSGFGGRGYKNPVTGGKEIVPSVTTVLKAENKPALIQWAVDQTAGYAVANATALLSHSEDWGYKYLRWYYKRTPKFETDTPEMEVQSYHEGVRDDAADMGTAIHEWIQADLVPELQYPDLTNQGEAFWQMVDKWEEWKQGKEIVPHYTERTVWNPAGYAGTYDGLWEVDGRMTLMDIKSSRGIYDSTWMQVSALYEAPTQFEPSGDEYTALHDWQLPVTNLAVLHIRPNDWDNRTGKPMPAHCKWLEMPGGIDSQKTYYKGFEGLLHYTQAMREITLAGREREKNDKNS
jgi:hypothetical protein